MITDATSLRTSSRAGTLPRVLTRSWTVPAALFMLSLVVYLWGIDRSSLWYDEVASIIVAQRGPTSFLTDRFGWMIVQTPLHYLEIWAMLGLGDPASSAFWVRLPSALAAALTVPVTYLFGRDLLRRPLVGLLAALLTLLAPTALNYAHDVRPYTMLTLLVLCAVYCLGRATISPDPAESAPGGARLRWWAGFAAFSVLGIYSSYNTLTLALPAVAPFLAWVIGRGLLSRGEARRNAIHGILSLVAVGAASIPALLDISQVPRIPPDLSAWDPRLAIASISQLNLWFSRLALGDWEQLFVQPVLFFAALLGVIFALYQGFVLTRRDPSLPRPPLQALALCASMSVIPTIMLSVLSTTNVVYQRYALFCMPVYFLLVAYGFVGWLDTRQSDEAPAATPTLKPATLTAGAISLAVVALFACSLLFTSETITWKHDYRAASAYLAANARPQDTAVFVGTDNSVSRLYWHGAPPLASLNALDPRVGTAKPSGDLYWLIGYEHRVDPASMPSRWQFLTDFNGLLLFKEPAPLQAGPDAAIAQGMIDAAQALTEAGRTDPVLAQVSRSLMGNALQAGGDLQAAAQAYHDAGTLYPIGGEYRLTSEGFAQRGEYEQAWLDAVMAKAMQPERVDVHLWMADLLARTGQPELAEAERTVANSLQSLSSGAAQRSP